MKCLRPVADTCGLVANVQGSNENQIVGSRSGLADVDYEIGVHYSDTPGLAAAMVFVGGAWQSLPNATAISVLYEPGSAIHGYTPNQLHMVGPNS